MRDKPPISDDSILACLSQAYGISNAELEFLPGGNDATAWAYRVSAPHQPVYFLKIKRNFTYSAAVAIPYYLSQSGVSEVVAPIMPTRNRDLSAQVGDFSYFLYPFLDGDTAMNVGMSDEQWRHLGTILKRIHTIELPANLYTQLHREAFIPTWAPTVRDLQSLMDHKGFNTVFEKDLAAFWQSRQSEIANIMNRVETLGRQLQLQSLEVVLCHADIHLANILLNEAGGLYIVDWDGICLAPKERDLMFIEGAQNQTIFFNGYGEAEINATALAYYRYEWVVQEIGDFGQRIFLDRGTSDGTKADAADGFRKFFEPGDVVEAAYQADRMRQ